LAFSEKQARELVARYRVPEPRLALGTAIRGIATACLDVSDGLVADLGHIADVSRVGLKIEAAAVPLSPAAAAAVAAGRAVLSDLLTAGDDYELAFTAPRAARKRIEAAAARAKTPVARIGLVTKGRGVQVVAPDGSPMPI